jgi:hypothetical protein
VPAPAPAPAPAAAPAPAPPSDDCHPSGDPPRNASAWLVFVGEFAGARDDDESGYAHALRIYSFRPLRAWHGLASADETVGVQFIPNASDPPPRRQLPRFLKGQELLVVIGLGGMSGRMPILAEAVPVAAAPGRIAALGPPCWSR